MEMKKCKICSQSKWIGEFSLNAKFRSGRSNTCQHCMDVKKSITVEKAKIASAKSAKRWAQANKDKINQHSRDWYARNKEARKHAMRDYQKNNLDKYRANQAKRHALKKSQSPELTESQELWMSTIYKRAKLLTEMTGVPYDVDHWWPLSKGGLHVPWNLYVIPASENRSKSNKLPINA